MFEIERILNAREKKKKTFIYKIKEILKKKFTNYFDHKLFKKKKKTFGGWGLFTTDTLPPWENLNNRENLIFKELNNKLIQKINDKEFILSQFQYSDTDYKKIITELSWRHYFVFNSIKMVLKKLKKQKINIVECGVCDGLTIFFALNACNNEKINFQAYLYDAWEKLDSKDEELRFEYSYLDFDTVKKNLKEFEDNLIFNKGFIPGVFKKSLNPESIDWIHLDLNSNDATKSSLDYFYERLNKDGIILFDDYGGFEDTRAIVDQFFKDKSGHFINLPTGQGIFINA